MIMTQEKINVAELLKTCPKGMELDCAMFDDVKFISVEEDNKPICIRTGDIYRYLTKFGTWTFDENAKCIIFPKGKTTWEGFVPPCKFKDGDIIYVKDKYNQEWCSILSNYEDEKLYTYVDICITSNNFYCSKPNIVCECSDIIEHRFATEEEKEKLFKAIKDNGYKWNTETKTLDKINTF
jgi:hypothetical protein